MTYTNHGTYGDGYNISALIMKKHGLSIFKYGICPCIYLLLIMSALFLLPADCAAQTDGIENDVKARTSELEQQIKASPNNIELIFQLEKLYSVARRDKDARAMLDRIIRIDPKNSSAYSEIGYLLDQETKHDEALKFHLKAVELGPGEPQAFINLGLSYYYVEKYDKSSEAFNQALSLLQHMLEQARQKPVYTPEEIAPNISDQVYYLYNIALCYVFTNRPTKALENLEVAKSYAPDDENITSLMDKALESVKSADRNAALTDSQAQSIATARQHIIRNDPARAIDLYLQLLSQGVETPELHINIGKAYDMLGATKQAIDHYLRATEINPENPVAYYNLGAAYIREEKFDDAFHAMQRAVELNPDYASALTLLGRLEIERGLYDSAERRLAHAVLLAPQMQEPRQQLCGLFLHTKRYDQAAALGNEWLKNSPTEPEAVACLAQGLHGSGDDGQARAILASAIQINKDNERLNALFKSIPPLAMAIAEKKTAEPTKASTRKNKPAKKVKVNKAAAKKETPRPAAAKKKPQKAAAKKPEKITPVAVKTTEEKKPVKKTVARKKPAAKKQKAAPRQVAAKKKAVPPAHPIEARKSPIPVPPELSAELSEQINSFGEASLMTPPAGMNYDPEVINGLIKTIHGSVLYQDRNDQVWMKKIGGLDTVWLAAGMQPSLTGDSKNIVLVAREKEKRTVRAVPTGGQKARSLMEDKNFKSGSDEVYFKKPAISPDGRYAAALIMSGGERSFKFTIKDMNTGAIMRPLDDFDVMNFAWDPSRSDSLVFSSTPCGKDSANAVSCFGKVRMNKGKAEVSWMDSAIPALTGGEISISNMPEPIPVFSPSGNYLLLYSQSSYSNNIVVVDLRNDMSIRIFPTDLNGKEVIVESIAWSPDEKRFAFTNENSLWVMNSDGSQAFPVQNFFEGVEGSIYWVK